MGQKVNPIGIRLNIVRSPNSNWYADSKHFALYLNNDMKVRAYLKRKLFDASVSRILIERLAKSARVRIFSARPGVIIGRKGGDVETLRCQVEQLMGVSVCLNIEEVRKPDLESQLVAENIVQQLERRVMFRKAMKRAVQNTMRAGALGIKICVSGRLGGAEIARSEWNREGRVPLHTFCADIDYASVQAKTTYGIIGVKVWIFRGETVDKGRPNTSKEHTE